MRHWRDVGDACYLQSRGLQRANGGVSAAAGSLYIYRNLPHPHVERLAGGAFGRNLSRVRCALARTAEATGSTTRPANHVSLRVRDGHDGVIKRCMDVRLPLGDNALLSSPSTFLGQESAPLLFCLTSLPIVS